MKPLALLALLGTAGCATSFEPARLDREEGWIAVRGLTPVRQKTESDCGAAALAMALGCSLEEVRTACSPGTDGIRAADLRAFARSKGLKAYLIQGEPEDLERELRKGRPVLVGLIKPGPLSHYELVVGLNADRQRVLLLDPARGWRETSEKRFLEQWTAASRVALVMFNP